MSRRFSVPRPNFSDITVVLDRSGSMATIADDTVGGLNSFVEDQKKHPGEAVLSLYQFDDVYEAVHRAVPLPSVPPLTRETFVPRGSTALLDAIGRAIVETGDRLSSMAEHDRPSTVVFVVTTDGQENASKEYTKVKVNEMIAHQRDVYGWHFIFLGANQDAISTAASLSIPASNAMTYASNKMGTPMAYASASVGVSNLRSGSKEVFSDADRAAQRKAGAKH
jgi:hypothetical protein